MRRSSLLFVPALLVLGLLLTAPGGPPPPVAFTHGVASGDVTPFSAVLWTRVDQAAKLKLEVSTNQSFQTEAFKEHVLASADNDFTVKAVAAPLAPGQTYYYRWRHGNLTSDVGSFKTAPLPSTAADVRFAFAGDSDGFGIPVPFGDFGVLDAIGLEDPDFWVYLGDTIYSDSGLRPGGPATTLDQYRDAYKLNRGVDSGALADLMAATSTYAIWDDHEVQNDFDGQTVNATRYANGREAFLEYMPMLEVQPPDPACAGDPLFRVFRWGKDTDVIVLDERSCRSADVLPACIVAALGQPDLAPTLPTSLRIAFGGLLPSPLNLLLQPSPPAGCLTAINDSSRTMLGSVQKELLKAVLQHSDAKFKFVINEVPIQQIYALPYDRWEGYGAERAEILNFISDNSIDNVIFLTTDTHANMINEVKTDILNPFAPVAGQEFVTGPIATNTFEAEIRAFFGGGPLGNLGVFAFNQILDIVGVNCRDLNVDSYGLVEVDASAGTATVTLKDDQGNAITDKGPLATGACTKTIGP
jgi:alkaline phosphatase D